jgi:multimeric flavodoxin WrbA
MNDDYQTVLDEMLGADRILFATPVFFLFRDNRRF